MKQEELSAILRDFRERLAEALLNGSMPYGVGSTMNDMGYVSVEFKVCDFRFTMSVNEKGFISYHDKIIVNLFGDGSENEKNFIDKVFGEFHANEIANAMKRKGELQKEIAKLDKIIGEEAA